jgi:prepilin-type N-terminal cleavage/methylation domain-containing protein
MQKFKRGFTLLEIMLVLAVVVIISSIGIDFYTNYGKGVEISSVAQIIISDLKQAQAKTMIGEGNFRWGIHFVNTTTDKYEIFSTPTDYSDGGKVILATNFLGSGVKFSDPTEGLSKDIIFNKVTGGASASSVSINSSNITKIISVSSIGNISVQ